MNSANPQIKETFSTEQYSFWKDRRALLSVSAVLAVTFVIYLPSLNNGFVNWDDQVNIYENPYITGISNWGNFLENVRGIFSTHVAGNYNPLPILSFAIEKILYGFDHPGLFHLNNIILHLICVFLVFRIASALGLKLLPAIFCALLFGIHPMRVESVAWVTERKDVLYGTFYLIALHYYIKSVKFSLKTRYSLIILASFILALFSKIQAVSFPLSMVLVDYYFGRKLSLKLVYEKWLYFSFSLVTGIVGLYLLRVDGGIQNNTLFSFFERLFIGSYSYIVYLIKSLFPYRMVPVYPYPATLGWEFYASLLPAIGILTLICHGIIKQQKEIVFGLLFFTVNIMFMLQILGAGQGFIADRFSYIAYFGLFFIYSFCLQWLLVRYPRFDRLVYSIVLIVLGIYGYIGYQQNRIWKNGETLWTHVLDHYPQSALVWENRADYYQREGRISEAIHDFSRAIILKPDNPVTYYSRGNLYLADGESAKLQLAIEDYNRSIQLAPGTGGYFLKRGLAYLKLDRPDNAIRDFQMAERLIPEYPDIYFHRSRAYFKLERYDAAQSDLEKYLQMDPENPSMWSNLGTVARLN